MSRKGCLSRSVGEILVIYPQHQEIRSAEDLTDLRAELNDLIAQAKHGKVVLNLELIDSLRPMEMRVFMQVVILQSRTENLIVKLCGCKGMIKEVIALFKIHRAVEVLDTEADAISSFEKKKGWFGW